VGEEGGKKGEARGKMGRHEEKWRGRNNKMGPVHGRLVTSGCLPVAGLSHCCLLVLKFFDFDFDFLNLEV
jgi:hypothetical protein